jgi:hypothetical protein
MWGTKEREGKRRRDQRPTVIFKGITKNNTGLPTGPHLLKFPLPPNSPTSYTASFNKKALRVFQTQNITLHVAISVQSEKQ